MRLELSDSDLILLADRIVCALESRLSGSSGQPTKLLWSEAEVADMLGVTSFFLKDSRQKGYFSSHTTKRPILYDHENIDEIRAWLANR